MDNSNDRDQHEHSEEQNPSSLQGDVHKENESIIENVLDETSVETVRNVIKNLAKCDNAINRDIQISQLLRDGYFKSANPLTNIEDRLLELAARGHDTCDGIYYTSICKVDNERYIARYFQQGAYNGIMNSCLEKAKNEFEIENLIPYSVYTERDVEYERNRHGGLYSTKRKGNPKTDYRIYQRKVFEEKHGVKQSIDEIERMNTKTTPLVFFICCIIKKNFSWDNEKHDKNKFYRCTSQDNWESILAPSTSVIASSVVDIKQPLPDDTNLDQQQSFLNSLPNHHKWKFPNVNNEKLKYEQRFSNSTRRLPGSPRNKILHACTKGKFASGIIFDVLYNVISGKEKDVRYPSKNQNLTLKAKSRSGATKKRKLCEILASPSEDETEPDVEREMETQVETPNENSRQNQEPSFERTVNTNMDELQEEMIRAFEWSKETSLTQFYCYNLFRHGFIAWRKQRGSRREIILNDYNDYTGAFLKYDYCTVTITATAVIEIINCDCKAFKTPLDNEPLSCCHINVVKMLLDILDEKIPVPSYVDKEKLHRAVAFENVDILQLDSKSSVDRFALNGESHSSFITLSNVSQTTRSVVCCHSTICKMSEGSKRAVKRLQASEVLCEHLTIFRRFYMNQIKVDDTPDDQIDVDDDETPATLPESKWADVFDDKTGSWQFSPKSISQNKVDDDPFSAQLTKNINEREKHHTLYPYIPTDVCPCSAGWISDIYPKGRLEFHYKTKLYTENKVIDAEVFRYRCLSGRCTKTWDGAEQSIFALSSSTAITYEIGWEFVDAAMTSHQTFSGFVTFISNRYRRRTPGAQFVSVKTFIDFFFAWASRMNIDFRQKCSGCTGSPLYLACDGTKLGINFRNTFVSPIEATDKEVDDTFVQTRRHDRCFIYNRGTSDDDKKFYALIRENLRGVCNNILKGLTDLFNTDQIRSVLPDSCHNAFDEMLDHSTPQKERVALATVFKLLSFDSAVDCVIPFDECRSLISRLDAEDKETAIIIAHEMRFYSHELSILLDLAVGSESLFMYVVPFIRCIAEQVIINHQHDIPADPVDPIPLSYNPAKFGRAYYFSEHGCQVRQLRRFPIDKENTNTMFDSLPDILCEKRFPQISKKGTSYLFLWFCPEHGHCWGYHIIPGSEGRKDPAASLYMYLPKPPKAIFYDYACNLSEYNKNRESGYYCCSRFYHDIFHGFTHKCTNAFRCDRLLGMSSINTSICEQFNAFIKKIKASSTLMSQCHFTFYLQFFINRWNKAKEENLKRKRDIARASQI